MKAIVQKVLAERGFCSRREGERLVAAGKVRINGSVAPIGALVSAQDDVTIEGFSLDEKQTVAVYKPRGIVCSRNGDEGKTIFESLPQYEQLHAVGRLDKESEGLLILTNDGRLTRGVTGDDHRIEKEYIVEVREEVFPGLMQKMEKGIMIDGERTRPCTARLRENKHSFMITLKEGRKHQIRRMCDACHLTVVSLKRIRIGSVRLLKMRPGNVRPLSAEEIKSLL
ncbi:MAG: pseudouridylate synthase specific to ribosomal small subunit, rRNA pseudouridine2604 synthase [Candidatus Parcubacteria bacterium]